MKLKDFGEKITRTSLGPPSGYEVYRNEIDNKIYVQQEGGYAPKIFNNEKELAQWLVKTFNKFRVRPMKVIKVINDIRKYKKYSTPTSPADIDISWNVIERPTDPPKGEPIIKI